MAYKKIKEKFGFCDAEIKELLKEHTMSEILAGEYKDGKFTCKEIFFLDALLIILIIAAGIYFSPTAHGHVTQILDVAISNFK